MSFAVVSFCHTVDPHQQFVPLRPQVVVVFGEGDAAP
jgi:hypothetical protein